MGYRNQRKIASNEQRLYIFILVIKKNIVLIVGLYFTIDVIIIDWSNKLMDVYIRILILIFHNSLKINN